MTTQYMNDIGWSPDYDSKKSRGRTVDVPRNTHDTIISCLKANVANAKTKGMRDFAKERLREYQNQQRRNEPANRKPNWDRVIP